MELLKISEKFEAPDGNEGTNQPSADSRRIEAIDRLKCRLVEFVDGLNDEFLTAEPWFQFRCWMDFRFNPQAPFIDIFRSWQMFHWRPHPETVRSRLFDSSTPTIAAAFARVFRDQLSPLEFSILDLAQRHALDFYEFLGSSSEGGFVVRGVASGESHRMIGPRWAGPMVAGHYRLAHLISLGPNSQDFVSMSASPAIRTMKRNEFARLEALAESHRRCPGLHDKIQSDLLNLFYDLCQG